MCQKDKLEKRRGEKKEKRAAWLLGRAVRVVVSQESWLLQACAPFPDTAPCPAAQLPPHSPVPFPVGLRSFGTSPFPSTRGDFPLGRAHLGLASAPHEPGLRYQEHSLQHLLSVPALAGAETPSPAQWKVS